MNHFVAFWESLGHSRYFFLLLVASFLFHLIFMVWKLMVLRNSGNRGKSEKEEGVSVIITCSNKAELLNKNLEAFLTQDYPRFEVIVVDECSEDETQDVLLKFQEQYPHLKISRISLDTKFRRTKKIAINIGILAAQYDILLFSEIHCRPMTPNWIRSMQSAFSGDTAVVLGLANYKKANGIGKDRRRYFRFLWFWKAVVLNRLGMNVMGNGSNMGYRKKFYLEKRGFTGNTQEFIGYDTEMVRELSEKGTVEVVKDPESRMIICDDRKKAWKDDYSYYYATKHRWPTYVRLTSNVDFIVECFVYLIALYFITQGILREYITGMVLLTFLTDFIVINVALRYLGQKKLFLTSFTVNAFGFVFKWYYYIYSIFTAKKWR